MITNNTTTDKGYKYTIPPAKRLSEELYRVYKFNVQTMQKLIGFLRDTEQLGVAEKRRVWIGTKEQRGDAFAVNGLNYNTTHNTTDVRGPPSVRPSAIDTDSVNATIGGYDYENYLCAIPLIRKALCEFILHGNQLYSETPGERRGNV